MAPPSKTTHKDPISDVRASQKQCQAQKRRSLMRLLQEDDERERGQVINASKPPSSGSKRIKLPASPPACAEDEPGLALGRRQRRNSRYLSPPYTLTRRHTKRSPSSKNAKSPNNIELKASKKVVLTNSNMRSPKMTPKKATAKNIELRTPVAGARRSSQSGASSRRRSGEEMNLVFNVANVPSTTILSEILSTAVDPFHLKCNKLAKTVRGFSDLFRNSVYADGSEFFAHKNHLVNCGAYGKSGSEEAKGGRSIGRKNGGKGKANEETVSRKKTGLKRKVGDEGNLNVDSGARKSRHVMKTRRHGAAEEGLPSTPNAEHAPDTGVNNCAGDEAENGAEAGETASTRLKNTTFEGPAEVMLTFAPGSTLPSKGHLISIFSKYGYLIESETELLELSGSASVVFAKSSDARKALGSRDLIGAFGFPVPSYCLRLLLGSFVRRPLHLIPVIKPSLSSLKKNLETMMSILTSCSLQKDASSSNGMKPVAKEKLLGDMTVLLRKVNKKLNNRGGVVV